MQYMHVYASPTLLMVAVRGPRVFPYSAFRVFPYNALNAHKMLCMETPRRELLCYHLVNGPSADRHRSGFSGP
jgi:hypothetical protein